MEKQKTSKTAIKTAFWGIILLAMLGPQTGLAGDFILEYVGENYKETTAPSSYQPVIYHTIQVKTEAGPKIVVLKGDDGYYRTWLRQYIAQGKQMIAQIADDQDDFFISSAVFEIDVTNVHPVNLERFRQDETKNALKDDASSTTVMTDAGTGLFKEMQVPELKIPEKKKRKNLVQKKNRRHKKKNPALLKKKGGSAQERAGLEKRA